MKKEYKICEGCPACSPEDYCIEVTLEFLMMCRKVSIDLSENAPDYSCPSWVCDIDDTIRRLLLKYDLKEEELNITGTMKLSERSNK
jgi:hypothetical protein